LQRPLSHAAGRSFIGAFKRRLHLLHEACIEEFPMIRRISLLVLTLAAIALPVHAQDGCDDSPEDPTIVLALVAAAGAFAASLKTTRIRKP